MTAIDLLRKFQWRGDSYSCIGCGAHHRDVCKPECEVEALLAAPVTINVTINGKPVAEIIAAINSAPSSGTGVMLPSAGTNHTMRYTPKKKRP